MTAKEIFESIDLSQLPKEAADKFRKVEKATKGFSIESEKVNTFMRGAYKKIKETKPTALKNLKVEEKIIKKEVKNGKTTEVVENLEYKVEGTKKVSKKTPTPSKPKRKGETAMERARKIRRKDEAWKDALARAQRELKAEAAKAKKDAEKVVSTTSQALKSLEKMIQNDPKLKGYPRTYGNQSKRIDANKDAKIKAKPAGKRVSKKGHKNQYGESKGGRVYWENRDNRSDRYAPNFPNKVFLEMGGETDDLGFPTGHTFLVVEVSPDGTKNLIKSTTDYMTALMSSAVTRGRKTNKNNRVVIVDKEDKKVIHEAFEAGGEITITPTQLINNPDYLVGTTTMTELFEAGGVTAYQEGGEVFVTPSPLINAGSGDYIAGSNTMSNMFEDGGKIDKDGYVTPESLINSYRRMNMSDEEILDYAKYFVEIQKTQREESDNAGFKELTIRKARPYEGIIEILSANTMSKGGFIAIYNGKRVEIEAETLLDAKKKAIQELKVPKSKQGLLSVMSNASMANEDFRFMESGGNLLDQTMDENKAYYELILNGFIDYGHFDDDFKGSRFENNPKGAVKKFVSRMESFSKAQDKTPAAKYLAYVLNDTYTRNDLFRAFLKSEKDFEKELETAHDSAQAAWKFRRGENFAKGGKLPKNIKYYGVNEIKEYRLKNGDKIDPSKTFVDSGVYVSATKTMKPKEEEFQQKLEFKKGGATNWKGEKINWKEDYIYIPRFEIEEVELDNGKVIKGDYVVSGLYLPKSDRTKQLEKEMKARMKTGKFEKGGVTVFESVNEGTKPKFKVGDIVKYKGAKVSAKVLKVMPTNWENGYLIQFQDNKKKEEAGESSLVKASVNEIQYDDALAKFNKELENNSEVKKAAKHYKKSVQDVVKVLQSKIKVNRYSDKSIKQISINYTEDGPLSSKVTIKASQNYKHGQQQAKMETGGTIVAADPSAAMEDLNQTYGYESVYEKGGVLYEYDIEYTDNEGDEYSESFESLKEANDEIARLKKEGFRITRKYKYKNDDYVGSFEKGGRLGFEGLAKKVAKRYEGKAVKSKYQEEYGKTYSKEEAMEVGRKVAAKVYGQQQAKMEMGGEITQPYSLINAGSADYVAGSNTMSNMFEKGGTIDSGVQAVEFNSHAGPVRILIDSDPKYLFIDGRVNNTRIFRTSVNIKTGQVESEKIDQKTDINPNYNWSPNLGAKVVDLDTEGIPQMAKGGSLDGHGLQLGDKIVKDLGSILQVATKDGGMVYVDLASGYRGKDMPLPFAKGGAVGGMKIPDIAKKFGKTTSDVFAQLQVGEKHEMEHTNDPKKARKIALDHLSKDLDYYTKLNKLGL